MKPRSLRVPTALWEEAQRVADARGELISEVIRAALVAYVKRYGKDLK
jgi:hypothetical protein